jgi:hypothetical protein
MRVKQTRLNLFRQPPEISVRWLSPPQASSGSGKGAAAAAAAASGGNAADASLPEYTGGVKRTRLEELVGLYNVNPVYP